MRHKANSTGRWPDAEAPPVLQADSKDPLREAFLGRWSNVPKLQKIGVIVCVFIWAVLILAFLVLPMFGASDTSAILRTVAGIAAVTLLLTGFFDIVVWKVR